MIGTILEFKFLIIIAILIILDKTITVMTIKRVEKNYPNKDRFSVEKNPLAVYFFKNYGLIFGSIFYAILSYFSFNFSVWLLSFVIPIYYSYLSIVIIYIIVLINNFKWFVKFGKRKC